MYRTCHRDQGQSVLKELRLVTSRQLQADSFRLVCTDYQLHNNVLQIRFVKADFLVPMVEKLTHNDASNHQRHTKYKG